MRKSMIVPDNALVTEAPPAQDGTLTPEQVATLKAQNPGHRLFAIDLENRTYYMKNILYGEFRQLQERLKRGNIVGDEQDRYLVQECMLYPTLAPTDWPLLPAGVVPTLRTTIYAKSSFPTPDTPIFSRPIGEEVAEPAPTEEDLLAFRQTVDRDLRMAMVSVLGDHYIVRAIRRGALRTVKENLVDPDDQDDFNEGVALQGLVYPKIPIDTMPAGVPDILSLEIARLSGFNETATVVDL